MYGKLVWTGTTIQVYAAARRATRARNVAAWLHGEHSQEYADAMLNEAVKLAERDCLALAA